MIHAHLLTTAAFDTGPQFVFNFGGGPGIRVHQFGGARPRRRPREAQNEEEQGGGGLQNLLGLLPILLFFILPMLTSLFGSSEPSIPHMEFDAPKSPYTHGRTTQRLKVNYFVNPREIQSYSKSQFVQLDKAADATMARHLRYNCEHEVMTQRRMREDAMGWFYEDADKMAAADAYPMPYCERMKAMGMNR